ncbi:phosphate signaling complex protein PhoU [Clostridium cellulovorans]|uniref:Phosphate-specific transport system accessory protein PhoU n=1 Tax=Clostridium cellulovorans (strain ATCC 35296 / DSM 3052 / OCM 3 / 743B) TaxID=573061 RepID=D9SL88_CLOC7|nr:phosphate signaling complex protein PhoU [Clostridium cellulovorans]ADL51604.1 phosphate uptake regulator, PhoU [Clostridium cellulovorans 743B]
MLKSFDISVKNLHKDLLEMSDATKEQISLAVTALVNHDSALAIKVMDSDDVIDNLQKEIDDKAIRLIAMQNPMATDLRGVFSATKVASDLERMADYAVDIAKISVRYQDEGFHKILQNIQKMTGLVCDMIGEGVNAYLNTNVDDSYTICKKDDEVDDIFRDIFGEVLGIIARGDNATEQLPQLLFVCKYLERAADHVTNICENTIYLVTGVYLDLNK